MLIYYRCWKSVIIKSREITNLKNGKYQNKFKSTLPHILGKRSLPPLRVSVPLCHLLDTLVHYQRRINPFHFWKLETSLRLNCCHVFKNICSATSLICCGKFCKCHPLKTVCQYSLQSFLLLLICYVHVSFLFSLSNGIEWVSLSWSFLFVRQCRT